MAPLAIAILLCPVGARAQVLPVPERARSIRVRFEGGDALVTDRLRYARAPGMEGELYLRIPLPDHAEPVAVTLCEPGGCKGLIADRTANGLFVAVPESVGRHFVIQVRWEAPLQIEDGIARMLVANGDPMRRTPIDVELAAPGLGQLRIGGADRAQARALAPGVPLIAEATLPSRTTVHVARSQCGGGPCARVTVAAGRRDPVPVRTVLALPLSPSSLEITEARIRRAAELVLGSFPTGSEARFLTYGHGAPSLSAWMPAGEGDLASVPLPIDAFPVDEPVAEAIAAARGASGSMIVIAGGADVADAGALAADARRAGLRVSIVGVGDEPLSAHSVDFARRAGGVAVSLGDLLVRSGPVAGQRPRFVPPAASEAAIARRLAVLSAPVVESDVTLSTGGGLVRLGDLRTGQQIAWEGAEIPEVRLSGARRRPDRVRAPTARALVRPALASSTPATRITSRIVSCTGGRCVCTIRGGTSREVVARTFRRAVRPPVRACFRRARAGRPDFSARVVVAAVFQRGEPTAVRATGGDPVLHGCVEEAVRAVRLPALEETIVVHYPFTSRPLPPPSPIAIGEDLDARLADLFADDAVLLRPSDAP